MSSPAPSAPTGADRPLPLTVAAGVAAVEGAVLVLLGVLELLALSSARLTMGVTTAVFFAAYGAALVVCARGLGRRRLWARSPVVLGQLIQLGLAWNLRSGETAVFAAGLAAVALVVLVGVLHPATTRALTESE